MLDSDLRYAWRGLVRRPALAFVTILTLTVGIAANTIMFGVVDQLMLEPPALIKDPTTLRRVFIQSHSDGKLRTSPNGPYRVYPVLRAVPAFADVAAMSNFSLTMGTGPDAQMVSAQSVSSNFFRLLGAQPAIGRAFLTKHRALKA
jgi:hypothetical protein